MSMCFNFVLQTKATASDASAMLPLASFLAPSLVHAGPKDEAAALKNGNCLRPAQTQLSPSYLHVRHKPCSLFFWEQTRRSPQPHPPTAAHDLISGRRGIASPFSHLRRHCRLGRFCASAVSQQFNLLSPLGGDIFFLSLCLEMQNKSLGMTHFASERTRFLKAPPVHSKSHNLHLWLRFGKTQQFSF